MSAAEILMGSLAGLGMLFFGIKMVNRSLSAMAGDQVRRGIEHVSRRTGVAALFGVLAGFVTQSGRTTSFIMASFVEAGLVDARRALPVVLWSNFGCTLVIFAAVFPIHLVVLFLVGAAGVAVAFERPRGSLNGASVVFGLAVMLFGLQMMSSAAASMTGYAWFSVALNVIKLSLAFAFLTGLMLTFLAQSHLAIVLVAIAFANKGIFAFDQTLMVIYGAQAGASLITYVTGVHFRGQPRQVVMAQILYNLVGLTLFLAIFAVSRVVGGNQDLMGLLSLAVTKATGARAALAALIFNTVTPLLLTGALPLFQGLCARMAPPAREENAARPMFLRDEIGENTMATLVLAEKEQLRLLSALPLYCAWLREDQGLDEIAPPATQHGAFANISRHIARFQRALMSRPMSHEDTEWLLNQQKRQEVLNAVEEACHELCTITGATGKETQSLRLNVVEALDLLLISAVEAMANKDREELDLLATMTNDHGATMERVRKKYLVASDGLKIEERDYILQVTSIFERAAWSLRRFGALLSESPNMVQAKTAEAAVSTPA